MTASSCALVNDSLPDIYYTHPLNNLYNPIALNWLLPAIHQSREQLSKNVQCTHRQAPLGHRPEKILGRARPGISPNKISPTFLYIIIFFKFSPQIGAKELLISGRARANVDSRWGHMSGGSMTVIRQDSRTFAAGLKIQGCFMCTKNMIQLTVEWRLCCGNHRQQNCANL